MEREYVRRWSAALDREMELLRYGHGGQPGVAFPTSKGRFFQWEDFGLIGALASRLAAGSDDPNVRDSVALAESLRAKGVDVRLDLWPGWQHDWPYWRRMLDDYL